MGSAVKIITGDNEVVTKKICKEVGLPIEHAMVGKDLEKLSEAQLCEAVKRDDHFHENVARSEVARDPRTAEETITRWDILATASMMLQRSKTRTWAFRSILRSISPRSWPISSCSRKAFGARGGGRGRPQDIRQHHQVHQDDGEFEFRQRVQCSDC